MIEVPDAFRGSSSAAQALRFNGLALIIAAGWAAFAVQHVVLSHFRIAAVDVVACLGILAVRSWTFRRSDEKRIETGGHLVLALAAAGLVGAAMLSGQESAMASWFLCAIPLFAGFHLGARAAFQWTIVSSVAILAVFFSGHFVRVEPEYVPDETNLLLGRVVLLLMILGLTLATRRAMDHYIAEVDDQKRVIRDRATELAEARDAALDAVRVKDQFLANISHEIRTPLNGIIGMTGVLLDSEMTLQQREAVTVVQRSSNTLLGIINEILDYSRLDANAREPEAIPFDLRECIEDVIDMFSRDAWAKGIDLAAIPHPNTPRWIEGDITYLRQALINLVGNAVKFTDDGAVIVRVRPGSAESRITFTVSDTGIGIPADKQHSLFEPFTQVDTSTTRKYGGTGLGLAITKRLVELMGGTIEVESEPERGTTFRFHIVAPEVPPPSRPVTTRERVSLIGKRIAIEGGAPASRESVEAMLASWGVRLVELDEQPAVIITFDRLDPVRAANTPTIALVSIADPDAEADAAEGGAICAIYWPARHRALREAIEACIDGTPAATEGIGRVLDPTLARRIPARVLVAEDNPVNQRVAATVLSRLGYEPDVADDGAAALAALRAKDYDLVFMDLQMPELDGLEVTRRVRENHPPERQPWIVALTATVGAAVRAAAEDAGANDFLGKPFDVQSMMVAVERFGERRETAAPHDEPADAWSELKTMLRGAPEQLVELIELHLADATELVHAVSASATEGDLSSVKGNAHKLKSSSAQFGSHRVSKLARAIEVAAAAEDAEEVTKLSASVSEAWGEARARLEREADELRGTEAASDQRSS